MTDSICNSSNHRFHVTSPGIAFQVSFARISQMLAEKTSRLLCPKVHGKPRKGIWTQLNISWWNSSGASNTESHSSPQSRHSTERRCRARFNGEKSNEMFNLWWSFSHFLYWVQTCPPLWFDSGIAAQLISTGKIFFVKQKILPQKKDRQTKKPIIYFLLLFFFSSWFCDKFPSH